MFPASPRILSAPESFASQERHVEIGDFDGYVSGEIFERIMRVVREDPNSRPRLPNGEQVLN